MPPVWPVAACLTWVAADSAAQVFEPCETAYIYPDAGGYRDGFSAGLTADGDLAAIGAPLHDTDWENSGSVFVYRINGASVVLDEQLVGDTGTTSFGGRIALSGERLLVMNDGVGALFERIDGEWIRVAEMQPVDVWGNIHFGASVALYGDIAAIGAKNGGPLFVFERQPDGSWPEATHVYSSDFSSLDNFGWDLDVSGETIVVGARDDDDFGWDSGSAYVFERQGDGSWIETAKLLPNDGITLAGFGSTVAVDADEVAVGAPAAKYDGLISGAVYIYRKQPSGEWLEVQELVAPDAHISQDFGFAVDLCGNRLLVGARYDNANGPASGCAYLFERDENGGWHQLSKLLPSSTDPYDVAGSTVALTDTFALVGAPETDIYAYNSGAAYVFATGPDVNGNDVADPCECVADIDGDGIVGQRDLGVLLSTYELDPGNPLHDPRADVNNDGVIDQQDLSILLAEYETVCP
jgi:FG-GAP repeat